MITSNQNSKIKHVRALFGRTKERREAGEFVIEGVRLVEEAVRSQWKFKSVLYDETLSERGLLSVKKLQAVGVDVEEVSASVMKTISETEAPQGILAVLETLPAPISNAPDFILIPDQIRDPGNLGTLLRSAAAAGAQGVLLPPETTDAFSPKVLRAGMGAHFRLSIVSLGWQEIESFIKSHGLQVHIADMVGHSCWQVNLMKPVVLIIGNEAEGVSESARKLSHEKISIPMSGEVESLNAGVAGSVLMFEVMRQRVVSSEGKK